MASAARAMHRVRTVAALRKAVARFRARGLSVGLVPTMGAIHDGHLSLVRRARAASDRVVATIFVNPLQFGPTEDFARYPRPVHEDRAHFARAGVDLLWEPAIAEIYPAGDRTRVRVSGLTEGLEGASRPAHFEGVTTVVLRLLNAVQPDVLWLGQKDAQQATVIERMVKDLLAPVRVRRGATVRERDGLALSSRNAYLGAEERAQAAALYEGLRAARARLEAGERSTARLAAAVRAVWQRHRLVREDYIAVVDAATMEPLRAVRGRVLVAVAARVGPARLIDNLEWSAR